MYLDAHRYQICHVTENSLYCVVSGVFHRYLLSWEINWNSSKKSLVFRCRNQKKNVPVNVNLFWDKIWRTVFAEAQLKYLYVLHCWKHNIRTPHRRPLFGARVLKTDSLTWAAVANVCTLHSKTSECSECLRLVLALGFPCEDCICVKKDKPTWREQFEA